MRDGEKIEVTVDKLTLVGTYSFAVQEGKEASIKLPGVVGRLRFILAVFAGSGNPSMDWKADDAGLAVIIKHIGHTEYMSLTQPAYIAWSDVDPLVGYWIQGHAVPHRKSKSVFITLSIFMGPVPEGDGE